jgi:hypothetical protein
MNPKIELRDPADLIGHYHPALRDIPELPDDSPEFLAIASGMHKCGIIQPLLVDEKGRILDDHSRTLLRCARRWQCPEVPVQVRDSADVHLLIIHSLAHRRQLTKSAIAYLACPHLDQAFNISREKGWENLKKGQFSPGVAAATAGPTTVENLAVLMGIERNLLFEARKVRKEFEDTRKYPRTVMGGAQDGAEAELTLREWYEPLILRSPVGGEHESNRPMGLGGVIAGIASDRLAVRKGGPPRDADRQLELFTSGLGQLLLRASRLGGPEKIRATVRTWLDEQLESSRLSDDQLDDLEALGQTIRDEARGRRKKMDKSTA